MKNDTPSKPSKTMHPLSKVFLAVALTAAAGIALDPILDKIDWLGLWSGPVVDSEPLTQDVIDKLLSEFGQEAKSQPVETETNQKPSIQPDSSTGPRFPAPE